jgi:hypothetical protein
VETLVVRGCESLWGLREILRAEWNDRAKEEWIKFDRPLQAHRQLFGLWIL